MAGEEFDRSKFKELVLYLSAASTADEGFGMVKLNKLLYHADFEAYRLLGHSITGATYEKQAYGPVARELPLVLDELGRSGYLRWEFSHAGPYTRKVPSPAEHPDLSLFASDEHCDGGDADPVLWGHSLGDAKFHVASQVQEDLDPQLRARREAARAERRARREARS